jgi:acyl carrier protein
LPTYPFERQRYWVEPQKRAAEVGAVAATAESPEPAQALTQAEELTVQDSEPASPTQLHPRPKLKTPYIPPTTDLEKRIAAICTRVLGILEIGVDDIFFELGGDSFMALQVVAGLKKDLGVEVPVVTLYEKLTIRSLAAMLQSANDGGKEPDEPVGLEDYRQDRIVRRRQYQQSERIKKIGA